MSVAQKLRVARDTLAYLGPRWVAYRMRLACETRCGVLKRRLPVKSWDAVYWAASHASPTKFLATQQSSNVRFFFRPEDFSSWDFDRFDKGGKSPLAKATAIGAGQFELF